DAVAEPANRAGIPFARFGTIMIGAYERRTEPVTAYAWTIPLPTGSSSQMPVRSMTRRQRPVGGMKSAPYCGSDLAASSAVSVRVKVPASEGGGAGAATTRAETGSMAVSPDVVFTRVANRCFPGDSQLVKRYPSW